MQHATVTVSCSRLVLELYPHPCEIPGSASACAREPSPTRTSGLAQRVRRDCSRQGPRTSPPLSLCKAAATSTALLSNLRAGWPSVERANGAGARGVQASGVEPTVEEHGGSEQETRCVRALSNNSGSPCWATWVSLAR